MPTSIHAHTKTEHLQRLLLQVNWSLYSVRVGKPKGVNEYQHGNWLSKGLLFLGHDPNTAKGYEINKMKTLE